MGTIMKTILSLILALFLFVGCKTCEPTVIERWRDRETVRIEKDSVYFERTDTIREYQRGDTIFKDVARWRVQYRERLTVDTLKVDSIVTRLIEIPVEKRVEVIKRDAFWWSGVVVWVVLLAWFIFKNWSKWK